MKRKTRTTVRRWNRKPLKRKAVNRSPYFAMHALSEDVAYTSLVQAKNLAAAELKLRKEKRFRKTMRQNDLNWKTVPVIGERTTALVGISGSMA